MKSQDDNVQQFEQVCNSHELWASHLNKNDCQNLVLKPHRISDSY